VKRQTEKEKIIFFIQEREGIMKISKKQWLKSSVVFFIMAGLFSLPGAVSADNGAAASRGNNRSGGQTKTEFTTTMWHDMKNKPNETGPDSMEYVNAGVMSKDGEYHFTEDSRVTVANQSGASFVDLGDNAATKIQADKSLTFDVTNSGNDTITGITASTKEVTTINAKKLNIHAKSTKGRIEGIEVGGQGGTDKVHPYKLTINGDTDMNIQGIGYTLGLYACGNAEVVFNGNVTAMGDKENNIWGLYSKYGETAYYGCSLIYSGNSYSIQTGPKVTIEGDLNARIQGNGIFGNGGHAKLTVKGGGYLEIDRNNQNNYYAILAECATVSMNVILNDQYEALKANNRDLIIKGNVSASTGAVHENEPEPKTVINLGLATSKSEWTGVAYNKFPDAGKSIGGKVFTGAINLFLQNGAKWNNELYGEVEETPYAGLPFKHHSHLATLVGGDTSKNAGIIYQTNKAAIDIDHYKGFTTVVYKHDTEKKDKSGKGWKIIGRSTTIRSAEPGSEITFITDDDQLNTASKESADKELVNGTLNALANKLFYDAYKNGETNLQGKVGIAENLTTPSVTKILKDMTFKKKNGQGEYIPKEEPLPPVPTPQEQDVTEFNTPITGGTDQEYVDHHVKQNDGTYKFTKDSVINIEKDNQHPIQTGENIIVDAAGKTLTLVNKGSALRVGIHDPTNKSVDITAGKLIIQAESTGGLNRAYGIWNNADVSVHGDTEINAKAGDWCYAVSSSGRAKTNFEGLKASVNKDAKDSLALKATTGSVISVNAKDETVGVSEVQINGDISTVKEDTDGTVTDPSIVNMALTTENSYWTGSSVYENKEETVPDDFGGDSTTKTTMGVVNVWLQNGATWTNTKYGKKVFEGWKGSHVTKLTGGTSKDTTGFIYQNDENPITIDNYKGYTTIFYNHKTDKPADVNTGYTMIGGDTKVTKAEAGSVITLLTGNEGLKTDSQEAAEKNLVSGTLNALANKLWYMAHKTDTNLTGKVGIAEGLTTSSVSKTITVGDKKYNVPESNKLKDITWKADGQGQYEYTPEQEKPPVPQEQDVDTFTTSITGKTDQEYVEHHVKKENGLYQFTRDTTISGTGDDFIAIDNGKNKITVDAKNKVLSLKNGTAGIASSADGMSVTAKKIVIDAKGTSMTSAAFVEVKKDGKITINGDVEGKSLGNGIMGAYGFMTRAGSTLTINGNVIAKGNESESGISNVAKGEVAGIWAGTDSHVTVSGSLNVKTDQYGVFAHKNAEVKIGGGEIIVPEKENKFGTTVMSIKNESGHVSINMDNQNTKATLNKVILKGNIGLVKENSRVDIGLSTSDSSLTGLVNVMDIESSKFNLILKNGAIWNNVNYGNMKKEGGSYVFAGSYVNKFTGGTSADTTGFIYQNDEKPITIGNYKGYTTIFYNHKTDKPADVNTGYTMIGGDTKVTKAEAGSVITLLTGNEGLKTDSQEVAEKNLVSGTLNALANKLWYMAHKTDTNLTGKVGIAEGLTSRSVSKTITVGDKKYNVPESNQLKDITWKADGQGQYEYTPEQEKPPTPPEDFTTKTEFTESITGDKATDVIYEKAGILKESGKYELNRDIKIKTDGQAGIYHLSNSVISGTENMLSIENMYKNGNGMAYGVSLSDGGKIDIKLKKLNISVDSTSNDANLTIGIASGTLGNSAEGNISITGNVDVKVHGNNVAAGVYAVENHSVTINGNLSMVGDTADTWGVDNTKVVSGMLGHYQTNGIYAGFNGGKVHVNGDVNMAVKGTGMQANKNSEIIVTGGGTVRIAKDMNADQYALEAEAGMVSFHYAKVGEPLSEKDVIVEGNIGVLNKNSGRSPNEDNAATDIYLGLNTVNSKWTGVAFNQFNEQGKDGGKIHLYLGNGATWNHEKVGMTHSDYKNSHIYELIGDDKGGVINQNDSSDIIIDKMSGKYTVFMAHQNKGLTKDDYKVGNVYVKDANSGAEVTMITDTSGNIDMTKEEEVYHVLNTLAGKLFYQADNTNLTGKVAIAEGLTTTSKVKEVGDISFNKAKQGQGSVVRDSIKPKIPTPQPPNPPQPNPPLDDEPIETLMMNGGKNAMALAATIWISNNNDLQRRMGDIRLSQSKNGLWARYLGGKNVWNPNQTNIDQQYNNIQIGYDTKVNGWTVGGAFDYGTSNDKYFIKDIHKLADASGDGKEKQYNFALYGSRQFEDGQYVDIIFKGAKVNSQYVLNYLGKQMKGDYNANGVSISGEYGKRISDGNTYIEPSIEFTAGHLSAADYKASSTFKNRGIENANMTIHQDAFNTLRGRLGLAAGYQTEKSNAFVKLSLNKEFGGDIKATFRADGDAKNNPTTLSLKDTWLDVEVGGSYLMNKDTYLYANLTKSFSAIVKTEWRLDAGIRLAF